MERYVRMIKNLAMDFGLMIAVILGGGILYWLINGVVITIKGGF